jgi:hypothetical protein
MWRTRCRSRIDVSPIDEENAMLMHPDVLLTIAGERHRELVAEADRERLLACALRARRGGKAEAARGHPTGTLSGCEASAAVPAR